MTYDDPTTPQGLVRLLLNDVDESAQVFTDQEIDAFLILEGQDVKRAAAQAIDTNADNELLASKVITSQDVATDGAKLAAAMHARAAALRQQSLEDEQAAGYFEIVDTAADHWRPDELAEIPIDEFGLGLGWPPEWLG